MACRPRTHHGCEVQENGRREGVCDVCACLSGRIGRDLCDVSQQRVPCVPQHATHKAVRRGAAVKRRKCGQSGSSGLSFSKVSNGDDVIVFRPECKRADIPGEWMVRMSFQPFPHRVGNHMCDHKCRHWCEEQHLAHKDSNQPFAASCMSDRRWHKSDLEAACAPRLELTHRRHLVERGARGLCVKFDRWDADHGRP